MIKWRNKWHSAAFLMIIFATYMLHGRPEYASTLELTQESGNYPLEDILNESQKQVKLIGEEGIVLLKNNGLLPLSDEIRTLNVFGWASTNPVFGGTDSDSFDMSTAVGILDSLKDAGYITNEELTKIYTDYRMERPAIMTNEQDWTLPEPTVDVYTDDVMISAKSFSDIALIVISRSGGQNADLPTDMAAVITGTYNQADFANSPANFTYMNASYTNNGNYNDFEEGETYLELSVTEEQLIKRICSEFDNVIVIINSNNPMELGWVDEYDQIGAVLLAPGAGITGFAAIGEIINGSVNPSGRTVDTFVKDLTSVPYFNVIGNRRYTNVDDLNSLLCQYDNSAVGNISFTSYIEGVYVGYKFYETAADEGFLVFDDYVQYPFGYGLSYTTFDRVIKNFNAEGDAITFDVTVTNTGVVPGKDVVEIYVTPPYTNGGIEKASVNLIDFAKTSLLDAGDSETISFCFQKEDLASYDSNGIKVVGGGYILEAGEYEISVRSDSHTIVATESFTIDTDINYSIGRASDKVVATNQFQDYSRGEFVALSRADKFANYDMACGVLSEDFYTASDELKQVIANNSIVCYRSHTEKEDEMPSQDIDGLMPVWRLRGKAYDDSDWEKLINQISIEEMIKLVNVGGWGTVEIPSIGKCYTNDSDGSSGLYNFIAGRYGTLYPTEIMMGQTWDKSLLEKTGECMSMEFREADNFGWYGPSMNIHRSAFAGGNYENFSEDAVLSGYLASAEVNGAHRNGIYAYLKSFALSEQEINRISCLLTWADEQAIREIYLKPFELAVKGYEGAGLAVMCSFNWIGSIPCCANTYLLNNVLRMEWGFEGFVSTDYDGSYGFMITENCIRNGVDLMLGFGRANTNYVDGTNPTTVKNLRRAVKNILYTQVNSGAYENISQNDRELIAQFGDYTVKLLDDDTLEITKYYGSEQIVSIPETFSGIAVSSIGDHAFEMSLSVEKVEIPLTVRRIGANPFLYCDRLKEIVVSPDHEYLATIDGILFDKQEKKLVSYTSYKEDYSYTIPRGILCIGVDAFRGGHNLTEIVIPDTVKEIQDYAFGDCEHLVSISLPDSISNLGKNPFFRCDSLEEISISSSHTYLSVVDGGLIDKVEKRLVTIFNSVYKDADHIIIPDGVEVIDDYVFINHDSVIDVSIPDSLRVIGNRAFYQCSGLKSIHIPNGVTQIGEGSFAKCKCLEQAILPDHLTKISYQAFWDCEKLTDVTIPDGLKSIDDMAFYGDTSLENLSIPASVTYIGDDTFIGCDNLKLTVERDSFAKQYCLTHGITFDYFDSLEWLNS